MNIKTHRYNPERILNVERNRIIFHYLQNIETSGEVLCVYIDRLIFIILRNFISPISSF